MAVKNTKASARLDGREVPEVHIRSQAVEQYIAQHASKNASGCTCQPTNAPETEAAEAFRPQTGGSGSELLDFLASEIWPLLKDRSPITEAEQTHVLGDPAES